MFSGIIEAVGQVEKISIRDLAMDLTISSPFKDLEPGESIAVNGVCLTVEDFTSDGEIRFHISGETLRLTNLGTLETGRRINLERAVSLNTRLSGHIVQGHVDTTGILLSVDQAGDSHIINVFLPQTLRCYVVEKGSVTLDGISLTVNKIRDSALYDDRKGFVISLMIIPHTWEHTDLSTTLVGTKLNIEVDILSKYVETLCRFSSFMTNSGEKGEEE